MVKSSLQKANELGRELGVGRVEAPNFQPGKKTDVNGSVQPTPPSSNQQSPTFAQNWQTGVDTLARWFGNTFGGNNSQPASTTTTTTTTPKKVETKTQAPASSGKPKTGGIDYATDKRFQPGQYSYSYTTKTSNASNNKNGSRTNR